MSKHHPEGKRTTSCSPYKKKRQKPLLKRALYFSIFMVNYHDTRKKRHLQRTKNKPNKREHRQHLAVCVWLPGRMHIEEWRRKDRGFNDGRRKQNYENETKTPKKGNVVASTNKNAWRIQVRVTLWLINYYMASEPARARLI